MLNEIFLLSCYGNSKEFASFGKAIQNSETKSLRKSKDLLVGKWLANGKNVWFSIPFLPFMKQYPIFSGSCVEYSKVKGREGKHSLPSIRGSYV